MVPAGQESNSARVFLWLALFLGAAVLSLYIFVAVVVFHFGPRNFDPGWTYTRTHGNWYVAKVDRKGAADGKLEPKDRIIAIDGDTRFSSVSPDVALQFLAAGSHYSIRVMRGGSEREIPLEIPVLRDRARMVLSLVPLFVAGLAFYAVGLAMGVLRPGYSVTRLGCISSFVTAIHFTSLILRSVAALLTGGERVVYELANSVVPWHLALGYAFFSRFPSIVPESRVWKLTSQFIYLYCFVVFLPRTILNFAAIRGDEFAIGYQLNHSGWIGFYQEHVFNLESAFKVVAAVAICLVLRRNYNLLKAVPDQRRRVRWVVLAAVIGIVLPAFFTLALVARGNTPLPSSGPYPIAILVTNLFSVVIPITLSYAVIKHRVFGINVVVRRGIQYLFARNSLRLLLLLPVLAIAFSVAAHPHRTLAEMVIENSVSSYGFIGASAAFSLNYRRQLIEWLDRKFFREAHGQELILLDLIERLRLAESVHDILRLIGTRVNAALHPSSLYICCREVDATVFPPGYSLSGGPDIAGTDRELLVRIADRFHGPTQVGPRRAGLPQELAGALDRIAARLIVPVRDSHERLIGLVLLGEKKSEEPYTTANLSLLKAIAAEMGISLDLIWLRERLENEQKIKDGALTPPDRQALNLVKECTQCGACFDTSDETCSWDHSQLEAPLLVERIIDEKYRLDRWIGKGGYGAVYEAWDLSLKRKVAIKVAASSLLRHSLALRRFEREAQAAARLNHPNIVVIYDFGPARPGGAYMAMELVRGATWRSELRRMRTIAPALAAEWLDQLLEGVGAAHLEGVIHRDLKPENVVIAAAESGPGLIKILDFGMAKMRLLDPADPDSLALAGTVGGTLGYMSPEQFTGEETDERSDIFSVGVMTMEALSGHRPFRGRTPAELTKSMMNDAVLLKAEGREGKEINRVLRRCLAKKASDRYPTVHELRQELIPAVRNCPPVAVEERPQEQSRTMTMTS